MPGVSSGSWSLAKSPTSAVSRSTGVTIPSRWPYSSCTMAMAISACCSTRSASTASSWSGTTSAFFMSVSSTTHLPASIVPSTSRTRTRPIIRSGDPSATGHTECGLSSSIARIASSSALTSIQSRSVRGVITSRTGRWARRTTPASIWCCSLSITPLRVASAKSMCSSSAVTELCPAGFTPSRRISRPEEASSSQTSGAATFASSAIGRAMMMEIGTAARSATCLGTSSPTTRLR